MNYKLYENASMNPNLVGRVLENRDVSDWKGYLNLKENVVIDYKNLSNIEGAVECFVKHYEQRDKIAVLVDTDVDGYVSASAPINYVKKLDPDYPIYYIMHDNNKAHGIDKSVETALEEDTKLFIIPDAATNDYKKRLKIMEDGIDIIVLDHHECEHEQYLLSNGGIVVNNQTSNDYPNKDFCGAGIVYKFLKALDEELWVDYADEFLDLVAFGNISDVMDMRSKETRYLTNLGLKNIKNKFMQALIKAQDYSMNGKVNIHNVQWYLTPVCNAMIRIGSQEERELMFKAFIEQDEFFEYKKRATKDKPAETITESIYDRAARLCKNAKSRQDKMREKGLEAISNVLGDEVDDKVIILDIEDMIENRALTGVVAIKVAEKYNRPCLLLKRFINDDNEIMYGGSARNFDHSPIENMKDVTQKTGLFSLAQGHANAYGVQISVDNMEAAKCKFNKMLKDVEYDASYLVDYIFEDAEDIDIQLCTEAAKMGDIICQGIEEPMVAIESVVVDLCDIDLFGKNMNTISFKVGDIEFIQFFVKKGNPLYDWINDESSNGSIELSIVGKPGINTYNGISKPQIVIEDMNVISINKVDDGWDDEDEEW